MILFSWTGPCTTFRTIVFKLGSVVSLFFCYDQVWGTVYLHIQIFVLSGYLSMWRFIKLDLSI